MKCRMGLGTERFVKESIGGLEGLIRAIVFQELRV